MNNVEKYCLIGKIKGLAVEVKRTRSLLHTTKKEEKIWRLAATKRAIGLDARHHLLAYALLKGTSYRSIESKCREDNKPAALAIHNILSVHVSPWTLGQKYSIESIDAWLKA